MTWPWVVLVAVVAMAAFSLRSFVIWRRDLLSGRPMFITLAAYTGVISRERLERLCGSADSQDRFRVSPERALGLPRERWAELIGTPYIDLACLVIAWLALQIGVETLLGRMLVGLGGTYLAANIALSVRLALVM